MKILFFCWEFPPVGSGIGGYIREMANALLKEGHFVVIVTSKATHLPEREQLGEFCVIYRLYDKNQIGSKKVAENVLEVAAQHHIDWIEVADHLGEGASLLSMAKRPLVVLKSHYNDVIPNLRYGQARWFWQRILIDLACYRDHHRLRRERQSIALADGLLCITQRGLQEIESAGVKKPLKYAIVPNPIQTKGDWINHEGIDPTILFVGRIDFGKGVDFLPAILRRVVKDFPQAQLQLAGGDGYARGVGSIKKWVEKQFIDNSNSVSFLGHISTSLLDEAYRRAWVVVVPSRWDTFPMAVLEAMSRGKAVVASGNGGMPEMLADTSNRIADPESIGFSEAVIEFLEDHNKRREAGRSGLNKAKEVYSPSQIAKDYVNTIRKWL